MTEFEKLALEFTGEPPTAPTPPDAAPLFTVNNPVRTSPTAATLFVESDAAADDLAFYAKGAIRVPMLCIKRSVSQLLGN